MTTEPLGRSRWLVRIIGGVYAALTFGFLICKSDAQITVIDFENIPPLYTPVESFGELLPGVTLAGGGQWIADTLNSWYFENMYGRAISAFPDGAATLSISFDQPVRDVRMDLDNLSFVAVPEPQALSLILTGMFVGLVRMFPRQSGGKTELK